MEADFAALAEKARRIAEAAAAPAPGREDAAARAKLLAADATWGAGMAPDGTRYFFAKRTGDTQWHEPAALQGAKLRLVLGEALPNGPTLPHPWRRLRDAETGRAYYWDVPTGTTQWERPDTPGVAEGALVSAKPSPAEATDAEEPSREGDARGDEGDAAPPP